MSHACTSILLGAASRVSEVLLPSCPSKPLSKHSPVVVLLLCVDMVSLLQFIIDNEVHTEQDSIIE